MKRKNDHLYAWWGCQKEMGSNFFNSWASGFDDESDLISWNWYVVVNFHPKYNSAVAVVGERFLVCMSIEFVWYELLFVAMPSWFHDEELRYPFPNSMTAVAMNPMQVRAAMF